MSKYTIGVYVDKAGDHHFRVREANGQVVATGSQGYSRSVDMLKTIHGLAVGLADAEMVVLTEEEWSR